MVSIDDNFPHVIPRLHEPEGLLDICDAICGDRGDRFEVSLSKEIHDLAQRLSRNRTPVCSKEIKTHCNEAGAPLKGSHA